MTFAPPLQMADAMEMMILSILAPQLHCEWRLPSWQVALLTSVGSWRLSPVAHSSGPPGGLWGVPLLPLLPKVQQKRIKLYMETQWPQLPPLPNRLTTSGTTVLRGPTPWGLQTCCSIARKLEAIWACHLDLVQLACPERRCQYFLTSCLLFHTLQTLSCNLWYFLSNRTRYFFRMARNY